MSPDTRQTPPMEYDLAGITPSVQMALLQWRYNDYAVDIGDEVLVAPPDPNRVAVGFVKRVAATQVWAAPWTRPDQLAFVEFGQSGVYWFKLSDYFTLVPEGWYLRGGGPGPSTVRVITVRRVM